MRECIEKGVCVVCRDFQLTWLDWPEFTTCSLPLLHLEEPIRHLAKRDVLHVILRQDSSHWWKIMYIMSTVVVQQPLQAHPMLYVGFHRSLSEWHLRKWKSHVVWRGERHDDKLNYTVGVSLPLNNIVSSFLCKCMWDSSAAKMKISNFSCAQMMDH